MLATTPAPDEVAAGVEPEAEPTEPEAKAKGLGPTFVAVMAVVFVAGALLRWWILGHDAMNADEAVVGLVARGILAGHPTAFVWHQAYGGVEPFAVAGMFGLFGSSPLTLNLTPVLLSAAVAALTWRVGLRLFTPRAALAAAALAWIWPESGVFNSTREYGYHEAALVFGMVVLLFTVRLAQRRPTPQRPFDWRVLLDWAVLGLAAGAGWWASPEIVYFVLPAAVVLLCTTLRRPLLGFAAGVATAVLTFALGVLPWVLAGVDDRWATIRTVRGSRHSHTWLFRLDVFFNHALPFLLGLQTEGTGRWLGGDAVGHVLYPLAIGAVVVALVVVAVWFPLGRLLVLCVVAFPFLYAAFPTSWFWEDGRYAVFGTPILALVCTGALSAVERPWKVAGSTPVRRHLAAAAMYALVGLSVLATWTAYVDTFGLLRPGGSFGGWRANASPTVVRLGQRLEDEGVHAAYGNYWLAYDLQFLTGGKVVTFPIAQDKNPADGRQVTAARRAAWLFVAPSPAAQATADAQLGSGGDLEPPGVTPGPLTAWLDAHHVAYRVETVGPFVAVLPSRNVTPTDINAPGTELG